MLLADGYTYEKAAIKQWLQQMHVSPTTFQILEHKLLVPNHAIASILDQLREQGLLHL